MKKSLLFIFMFSFLFAFSQSAFQDTQKLQGRFVSFSLPTNAEANIEGSPYILDDFQEASVTGYKGIYFIRYNAYFEEMEIRLGGQIKKMPTANIGTIKLKSSKTYQPLAFQPNKTGFAVLLWSDKNDNALYLRELVKFKKATLARSGFDKNQPAKYERAKGLYYIKMAGEKVKQLPFKKKKFFSIFGEKRKEVEAFVKSRKLRIDKEEDLKKIMAFYFS